MSCMGSSIHASVGKVGSRCVASHEKAEWTVTGAAERGSRLSDFSDAAGSAAGDSLLSVRDLRVDFALPHGTVRAVRDVSFDVDRAARVGLVGESGCGKSTL